MELHAFQEDSRGSSIERFACYEPVDSKVRCLIRGPEMAVKHLVEVYGRRGMLRRRFDEVDGADHWTHCIEYPEEIADLVERALNFYSTILLVPSQPPLRALVALGFYKRPPEPGSEEWTNEPAGELVSRAKYARDAASRAELAHRIAQVARVHPWYRFGRLVVSIPGSNRSQSFSQVLAADVAAELGLPVAPIIGRSEVRAAAKATTRDELSLEHEFIAPSEVRGNVVLLVDDVYKSGRTMKNCAAALSDAGATTVLGLVGARTRRAS